MPLQTILAESAVEFVEVSDEWKNVGYFAYGEGFPQSYLKRIVT
jgi:hypothetical protein